MPEILRPANKALGFIIVAALLFIAGYYIAYYLMSVAPQENAKRVEATVKAVCTDYVRTGEGERSCMIAQDASTTTFRCDDDIDPNAHCWVEDRQDKR